MKLTQLQKAINTKSRENAVNLYTELDGNVLRISSLDSEVIITIKLSDNQSAWTVSAYLPDLDEDFRLTARFEINRCFVEQLFTKLLKYLGK